MFDLLEEIKPVINKYFRDEKYFLEVRNYPEIFEDELTLIIKVDYSKNDIETLYEQIMSVKLESKRDLNLFITMEGI